MKPSLRSPASFALLVCLLGQAVPSATQAAEVPPNIVVFLADDLGYGDLHCYGNKVIQTPNLDAFASQGVKFTQGYSACAVCSPSRSAILTGRAPLRNGVVNWIAEGREMHLRVQENSIAKLLKTQGYATCHVGKWHLNGKFNSPEQPQPNDHGFEWWMATQNNAAPSHQNPKNFIRNGEAVGPMTGYSAPLVAQEAVTWLKEKRDTSKPFYLQVWTHEPHLPIESDPKFMALYPDLEPEVRQHHGNVSQMDAAFGVLMAALDELKLRDNTLVLFTSDNGPEGRGDNARTRGATGGLRGRKRDVYEGGVRVPFLVRWPGKTPIGVTHDTPVIGSDIFHTACMAAGVTPPADRPYDGVSLLPLFRSELLVRPKPLFFHCAIAPGSYKFGMRVGDFKILANRALDRFELYDLKNDPQEQADLSAKEPARFNELKKQISELVVEMETESPNWSADKDDFAVPKKKAGAEGK